MNGWVEEREGRCEKSGVEKNELREKGVWVMSLVQFVGFDGGCV